jgi:hypothetical protein
MVNQKLLLVITLPLLGGVVAAQSAHAAPSVGSSDILVTTGFDDSVSTIEEFTPLGEHVRSISTPRNLQSSSSNTGTEYLRGIAVNENGQIKCFNGTFTPQLDTYQPLTSTFTTTTSPGWRIDNNGSSGTIAVSGGYSFVISDNFPNSAMVRFNPDGTSQRFATGVNYENLSMGLDGSLYALYEAIASNNAAWTVDVFNPITLQRTRSITLQIPMSRNGSFVDLRNLAVDQLGGLYVTELNSYVHRFNSQGVLLKSVSHGHLGFNTDIKIDPNNTNRLLLSLGKYGAEVLQTDANLSSFRTLVTLNPNRDESPFVGFSNAALAGSYQNISHVLWTHGDDGQIMISQIDASGAAVDRIYTTSKGWIAKSIADTPDGHTHILWTFAPTGLVSIWNIAPNGAFTRRGYGPFPGQTATAMSAGPDGRLHLLWSRTDGTQSVWSLDNAAGSYTHAEYGPCPGWSALKIATGADNVTHLMWRRNSDAQVSLWDLNARGFTRHTYGPYFGQTPLAISAGSNGFVHLLWSYLAGSKNMESLWTIKYNTGVFSYTSHEQLLGWTAKAVSTDHANIRHILWSRMDGSACIWDVQPSDTRGVHTYGPKSGWVASDITSN